MAHHIEDNKAFYRGKPAWHGKGVTIPQDASVDTYQAAGMAYGKDGVPHNLLKAKVRAEFDGQLAPEACTTTEVIYRDDGLEIGGVGPDFTIVQPVEMAASFQPLLDTGMVEFEAGGSLRDGKQMWLLGALKDSEIEVAKGDTVKSYFLMYTGFDGSLRLGMHQTNTRVVCWNTLSAAISEQLGAKMGYRFKHTKNIHQRIANAQETVAASLEQYKVVVEGYQYLATKKMTPAAMETYIKHVMLEPDQASGKADVSAKMQTNVRHVIDLIGNQRGLELVPAIRGTAWQAYNAVTEYITHDYGRSDDSRLQAQWFGDTSRMNQKAFELALQS